jgi:hypothetical protein
MSIKVQVNLTITLKIATLNPIQMIITLATAKLKQNPKIN